MVELNKTQKPHIHDYLPRKFWRLEYGWLAVLFECQEGGADCEKTLFTEAFMEEDSI